MLLERIEIDSCGSLERIHLGPFSHRANVVLGPPGSGKTATYEFVRNILLGSDRHWHRGLYGRIVWAGSDGLWHCRREADGTAQGRYQVTYEPRNLHSNYSQGVGPAYWEQTWNEGFPVERNLGLSRSLLATFVASPVGMTMDVLLEACKQAGLDAEMRNDQSWEVNRIKDRLTELDCKLESEKEEGDSPVTLQHRRQVLLDQIAHAELVERTPPVDSTRRQRVTVRLTDCQDEIHRLRVQESDLRRTITAIEHELATISFAPLRKETRLPIAQLRRAQLEGLDRQLVRLCQSVREIRSWLRTGDTGYDHFTVSYNAEIHALADRVGEDLHQSSARARLAIVRRQLEWFVREFQRPELEHDEIGWRHQDIARIWGNREDETYQIAAGLFDHHEIGRILANVKELATSLARAEQNGVATGVYEDQLIRCEEVLSSTIRQLIDSRDRLLQKIASEHQLSIRELTEAYGDWHYCQDQPHLYQWLLSDSCPPSMGENRGVALRRERLQLEHRELLDELSRTANRLDDSVRESKHLQQTLAEIPVYLPVVVDHRHRDWLKSELASVERRIRWWEGRQSLEEERRQLIRRLESLGDQRKWHSELLFLAAKRLDSFSQGRWGGLFNSRDLESFTADTRRGLVSSAEYQSALLAIRLAAVELLGRRGAVLPVIVDEPMMSGLSDEVLEAMAVSLNKFTASGNQLVLFTASRSFAERMKRHGAASMALESAKYYHMRYREPSLPRYIGSVNPEGLGPGGINRELDMAWRESHGVFDDPYWYRTEQKNHSSRLNSRGYQGDLHREEYPVVDVVEFEDRESVDRVVRGPASPFFLNHSSPVDQSPSVDAMAALRLRSIGVHSVGTLLSADAKELSRRLKLADVDEVVVRRWQDEARMVCEVPQMRNFDARILVGCGVSDSVQLSRMHPGRLLEKVEAFLATERGRQILRSGTSYELSRITAWIAAASRPKRRDDLATMRSSKSRMQNHKSSVQSQSGRERVAGVHTPPKRHTITVAQEADAERRLDRFYLEPGSPIVDAPSIGPKTASRLEALGYRTVEEFLKAQSDVIAKRMRNRKITTQMILDWQRQALLVCRIPHLRGHDAQLLVGVGVVTAEKLAQCHSKELHARVAQYSATSHGKRILRSSKSPDLAEVVDWIRWAQRSRTLKKVA